LKAQENAVNARLPRKRDHALDLLLDLVMAVRLVH
jgi:hypothetical protein